MGRRRTPERTDERGAVLVLFAMGLLVLMIAVGLGIDGGRMFEERRAAQSAADHAATAAAYSSCTGAADDSAIASGLASAATNGYDNDGTTNVVAITAVGTNQFRAAITAQVSGTFSRIAGYDEFPVSVEATAGGIDCGSGGVAGPGAIFAGGSCPGKFAFELAGSNAEIYGGVHSNGAAKTSGSWNDFDDAFGDDPFTYVGSHDNSGSDNSFQAPYPENVGVQAAWPAGWSAADITGAATGRPEDGTFLQAYYDLADANGATDATDTLFTDKVTSITKDGVYYTTSVDGMDIGSITWDAFNSRNVTLVATQGPIKISTSISGKTFNPYENDALSRSSILMISALSYSSSDDKCSKYAINVSGQGATWNGIMWAPGAMIEFSGSDNNAVNGTLISWSTRLSGQFIDIRYDDDIFATSPQILLIR